MQLTIGTILDAQPVLGKLVNLPLPVKSAYWIARLAEHVSREFQVAEQKRVELIKTHGGDPDEKGNVSVKPESLNAFLADFAELCGIEVEVDCKPISLESLESASLTPADFLALGPLVVE
jgi:hypothetical protein